MAGSPNSCIIKIGKHKFRTLVDTGAEVSLMHRRVYDLLKDKPRLMNRKINLHGVNGSLLKIDGCIDLTFSVGGTEMKQNFYVVREMNRNLILGTDWLRQHGVRIYFDLGCIRIGDKNYVNLEEDIHIASVIRIKSTTVIKPQTATICYGKVKYNPDIPTEQSYQICSADRGFLVKEPGLQIVNSVSRLQSDRSIPVLVVNKTNKTMRIIRHGILAKLESDFSKVTEVNSILKSPDVGDHLDLKDLDVPKNFMVI